MGIDNLFDPLTWIVHLYVNVNNELIFLVLHITSLDIF